MFRKNIYSALRKTKTRTINTTLSFILVAMSLGGSFPLFLAQKVNAAGTLTVCASCTYTTVQDAVTAASNGDTIDIQSPQTITSPIAINKSLTIESSNSSIIQTSGSNDVFTINTGGAGTTITNLTFVKSDVVSQNEMISVLANNVTISNDNFTGQFNIGQGEVERALTVGYVNNVTVSGNHFTHLRQPAYFNGASGSVSGNYVADTKGFVAVSESSLSFTGNTWGVGSDQNAVDIAIIKDNAGANPLNTDNYLPKLMQTSNANNEAVIEDQAPTTPVMTDAFVDASATSGGNGYPVTPYQTITPALSRIVTGGRVHIANGNYTEKLNIVVPGTQLIGQSQAGVIVTPLSNQYGQGLTSQGISGVSVNNMTIEATSTSGVSAIKLYNAQNITLNNLTVTGVGIPHATGIDAISAQNLTLSNVAVSGFGKNGIAITYQYSGSDSYKSENIQFSNVSSNNNKWAGIAFYNSNNAGTVGGNITGVTFSGSNTLTGNGQGLYVEGDSDTNFYNVTTPRWNISDSSGNPVNIGNTAFSGNGLDIINYQTNNLQALSATFSGKTGNTMTAIERQTENSIIIDQRQRGYGNLGLVNYYTIDTTKPTVAFTAPTPANNSFENGNFTVGYLAQDNMALKSVNVSLFDTNPAHSNHWVTTCYNNSNETGTTDSGTCLVNIPSTLANGVYYVQVGAQDQGGNWSVNATRTIIVDHSVPGLATNLNAKFQYDSQSLTSGSTLNITAKPSGNNLVMSWNAPVNDWVTGYQILATFPNGSTQTFYQGPNAYSWLTYNGFGQHGNGKYSYQVIAVNPNGNSTASSAFILYYDTQPPTASFTTAPSTGSYLNGNFFVSGTAQDNVGLSNVFFDVRSQNGSTWVSGCLSGVIPTFTNNKMNAAISCTINTSNLINGTTYMLRIHASDNAGYGNVNSDAIRYFTYDTSVPTVPTGGIPNNSILFTNNFNFTWNKSVDVSPVTYQFQSSQNSNAVNGVLTTNLWKSGILPSPMIHSSGAGNGIWYWQVRATDSAGNVSAWSPIWQVTLNTSATPTLISPTINAVVNGATLTNIWSTVKGAAKYEYQSFNNATGTSPRYDGEYTTTSKTATNVADGTVFYWRVRAIDQFGNPGPWSNGGSLWQVTVDNVAPQVTITSPLNGTLLSYIKNGTVNIMGSVTDTNPNHYYLNITGPNGYSSGPGTVYNSSSFTNQSLYIWNLKGLQDGVYTIDLEARDAAGNKGAASTQTIQVTVNNTPPTVTINNNNSTITTTTITPSITATDNSAMTYAWTMNPTSSANINISDPTKLEPTFNITSNVSGSYSFNLVVTDLAGNQTTETFTFKYNYVPPVITQNTLSTVNNTPNPPTNNQNTNNQPTGQVLGDSTTTPNTSSNNSSNSGKVKGASTTNISSKKSNKNFLFFGWWWLLILFLIFFILGLIRRSNKDN